MEQEKIPVLAVVGPTASGKTALGIALAQAYGGEIVSADSMQIYRGMDIATAKPTPEELAAVPHHLIGFLPPEQSFSVADYVDAARRVIGDIYSRGKLPVVVGGTGLYVTSLLEHVQFAQIPRDDAVRAALQAQAAQEGTAGLYAQLCQVDPDSAACIHPNNVPRLVRAMEVYRLTGKPLSAFKAESRLEPSPTVPCGWDCAIRIGSSCMTGSTGEWIRWCSRAWCRRRQRLMRQGAWAQRRQPLAIRS